MLLQFLELGRRGQTPSSLAGLSTLVLGLLVGGPAAAQSLLPDGPGKEATVKVCGTCHPAERGASVRLTRAGWQDVIAKMLGLGAKGTDAELQDVLDYLSTHFKGDAMAALNLNRATSIELEAVVGMLRRESKVWMAARQKAPCATLEDLKKVEGVDFRKIEKRRDRLVCF
jgi:competence protein ComEA